MIEMLIPDPLKASSKRWMLLEPSSNANATNKIFMIMLAWNTISQGTLQDFILTIHGAFV